jgi:GH25 family lysozyme M1 (1,4-beta-N-acetylmuramidase)
MVNQRQARVIDIDNYAQTGGTNFDLAAQHIRNGVYDFLIIKAGLGTEKSKIFDEQRQYSENAGIPYLTYHLVDPYSPNKDNPKENMKIQAESYVNWVGKNQPLYCVDIEVPYKKSRLPTRKELNAYLSKLIQLTGKRPILYTRVNILTQITGFMKDAETYPLWIADYVYAKPGQENKEGNYRYFDDFLEFYKWTLPPTVRGTNLETKVIMWQFSKKGKGPYYIYNEKIRNNEDGKQSADLNVSINERDEFMKHVFGRLPDLPKAAPQLDALTPEQIEELAQAGISPNVRVDLNIADFQTEEFVTLQEKLEKSGISLKIKVNIRENISK